jgi:hypothetical protein
VLDLGFAAAVSEPLVQGETARVVTASLVMVAEIRAGAGRCQEAAGKGLPGRVTQARRSGQRRALGSGPVLIVPASLEERRYGPRELPGVDIEPGSLGEGDGGNQDLVLGLEPCEGLRVTVRPDAIAVGPVSRGEAAPVPGAPDSATISPTGPEQ